MTSGEACHRVITTCEDTNNYYKKDTIRSSALEKTILRHYTEATNYVDSVTSNPNDQDELLLSSMGFTIQ